MDAAVERPLREPAIRSSQHILAPDQRGVADDALGDEFRVFHHIRGVADAAGDERFALRQLYFLPNLPFMRMTGIGAFDHISPDFHLEDEVDDVLDRQVGGVWCWAAYTADLEADEVVGEGLDHVR